MLLFLCEMYRNVVRREQVFLFIVIYYSLFNKYNKSEEHNTLLRFFIPHGLNNNVYLNMSTVTMSGPPETSAAEPPAPVSLVHCYKIKVFFLSVCDDHIPALSLPQSTDGVQARSSSLISAVCQAAACSSLRASLPALCRPAGHLYTRKHIAP